MTQEQFSDPESAAGPDLPAIDPQSLDPRGTDPQHSDAQHPGNDGDAVRDRSEQTAAGAADRASASGAGSTAAQASPEPTLSAPSPWGELAGHELTKGHGTGNDFLLLSDPQGRLGLDAGLVAAVCDRRRGIGADGFIRAVRSEHLDAGREVLAEAPAAEWFMDYRNGDGSLSEMCGNGVRVFVHYLLDQGLVDLPEGGILTIGTRAGAKTVARTDSGYAVDMGPWGFIHGEEARESSADCLVTARGLRTPRPGLSISMGNPHTVVALSSGTKLDGLGLETAPTVRPAAPEGTNVEFVVPVEADDLETDDAVGYVRMRVHERGSGETLSCGTGACAAAAATRFWAGEDAPDEWSIEVPGGILGATFVLGPDDLEHVVLAGPAELVGGVVLR